MATRDAIESLVRRIQERTKAPLAIESQSGMPGRLYQIVDGETGRSLSPRARAAETLTWLEGYMCALEQLWQFGAEESRLAKSFGTNDRCVAPIIGCLFCPCANCVKTTRDREASRRTTMKFF